MAFKLWLFLSQAAMLSMASPPPICGTSTKVFHVSNGYRFFCCVDQGEKCPTTYKKGYNKGGKLVPDGDISVDDVQCRNLKSKESVKEKGDKCQYHCQAEECKGVAKYIKPVVKDGPTVSKAITNIKVEINEQQQQPVVVNGGHSVKIISSSQRKTTKAKSKHKRKPQGAVSFQSEARYSDFDDWYGFSDYDYDDQYYGALQNYYDGDFSRGYYDYYDDDFFDNDYWARQRSSRLRHARQKKLLERLDRLQRKLEYYLD